MDWIYTVINSVKAACTSPFAILDIAVVAYIFYKIYWLMKETRAEQLLKGILLLFLLVPISNLLHLSMLNWILNNTITIGLISIVIIFQPEIRRALERLGSSTFLSGSIMQDEEKVAKMVDEIVKAVENLAKTKTGALIVIEQRTGLGEIISTGTRLDAVISSSLLENIFVVNTPLHDGAVIIREGRITAAGCFLPLTSDNGLNKKLGTRHRAGVGVSEVSDAIVVIVSEETGVISLAVNGKLTRNYNTILLKSILEKIIKYRLNRKVTFKEKVKSWIKRKSTNSL